MNRITPAYAGKSKIPSFIFTDLTGSPPPMRGKGFSSSGIVESGRITPAYAGKSTPK